MLSFLCGAPANAPHYCSEVYDKAVRAANLTADRDTRVRLYQQAQQAMYDDVPLVRLADVRAVRGAAEERAGVAAERARQPALWRGFAGEVA